MKNKTFFAFLFLLLIFRCALAQNIEFSASAKTKVNVGETFVVTYSMNVNDGNFQSPSFKGFSVMSGPNQSSSFSTQSYNGRSVQTVDMEISYVLMANSVGTYTISPAIIYVKGKSFKSNSLTITVSKGRGNSNQSNNRPSNNNQPVQNEDNNSTEIKDKDLFIKTTTDKKSVVLGEQIILKCKIYTKVDIDNPYLIKPTSFDGFWSQVIMNKDNKFKVYKEVLNGIAYMVVDFRKILLFPQKTGTLTINSFEVDCPVRIKTKINDPFANFFNDPFSGLSNSFINQNVEIKLHADPININVLPLPESNKPNDFSGAVGNLSINSTIDKTNVKTGDAITLKVTISGSGNLKLLDKLNINFPSDFEVYDPKIDDNITLDDDGMKGSRTFEYLIIPRNIGLDTINPISFSYYDLNKKQYITQSTNAFYLNISKGSGNESNVSVNSVNKEDIKYIGNDIRFIKKNNFSLKQNANVFFGSFAFWALYLLPVLLFILFVIIWRKKIKENSNIALMKNKKATKVAQKRLKKAQQYMKENNSNAFYEEIFKAMWGYLSDKLSISVSELSKETAGEAMANKGVTENTSKQFIETLNNCEFARFAPGGNTSQKMDAIYSEAIEIISIIEKELSK